MTEIDPDQIDGTFVPIRRPSVAGVELDGEAVLYDEASEAVHQLNFTATIAWSCFDGSGTLDELIVDVASVYEVGADVVRAGMLELTRELGRKGLLEGVVARQPEMEEHQDHDAHC